MTIAVTGATGQLGRLVIADLKKRVPVDQIVALARRPEAAADLGVEARAADYAKPETLVPALAGVETLLLISSNEVGQRAAQHGAVIDAAKAAGVKRIVYTSLLHADVSAISLAEEHRATEAALAASGVPFTVLRNGWYSENYLGSIAGALAHGALVGASGDGRISGAAREDYAEAAAAVAADPNNVGKIYELAGDDAWTLADLAAELSKQAGRDIPYSNLSIDEYAGLLHKAAGLPEGLAAAIAGWEAPIGQGALFNDERQLSALIGRPTTPLSTVVSRAIA